jgi:hypothetical protein
MTDQPAQSARRVNPDPYPSGIYSMLPYPPVAESPVAASGTAPASAGPAGAGSAAGALDRIPDHIPDRIGDIEVTRTALRTPVGDVPLGAATVRVVDELLVRTPTWAVIAAIVGFFVAPVVSLLFLLARESVPAGTARVTVEGAFVRHETTVVDPAEVALARSLAAG